MFCGRCPPGKDHDTYIDGHKFYGGNYEEAERMRIAFNNNRIRVDMVR